MSGYFQKDPDSELKLSIDWQGGYLKRDETVIDDLGWTIRPVEDVAGELRVVFQECSLTTSNATFAGGIPERIYMVSSKVRTTLERELERSIVFRVSERKIP